MKKIVPIMLFVFVPLLFIFSIVLIGFFFFGGGNNTSKSDPGNAMAYANIVTVVTSPYNIPQPLELALIGWESSGNWRATGENTNGTTDAGLSQINSVNWATYNMTDDPYVVTKNLNASGSILSTALNSYAGDWTKALYGYNGGSYENGLNYNPDYAPKVLGVLSTFVNQKFYTKVVSFDESTGDITLIVAVQAGAAWTDPTTGETGRNFVNPDSITVSSSSASVVAHSSPGDGAEFSPDAVLYKFALPGAKKGDDVKISVAGVEEKVIKLSAGGGDGTISVWPTPGYHTITDPFGPRIHPITHAQSMHTGVDIGAPMGVEVHATGSGTVETAGWNTAYGNMVLIDHGNGVTSLYGHFSSLAVMQGQTVEADQVIGYIGSTGYSTGPHLHFEIRDNGTPIDPLSYFSN